MVDFVNALKRPFTNFKILGIGILICFFMNPMFITFAFFAFIFIVGYGVECTRTAMRKEYELPKWKNIGDIIVKGLLSYFIGGIYTILYGIPLGVIGFFLDSKLNFAFANAIVPISNDDPMGIMVFLIYFIIVIILSSYLSLMAIMRFAESGEFKDALNFKLIFKKAFTVKYFISYFILIILLGSYIFAIIKIFYFPFFTSSIEIIGSNLMSLLMILTTSILNFVIIVILMTIFGETYSEIK